MVFSKSSFGIGDIPDILSPRDITLLESSFISGFSPDVSETSIKTQSSAVIDITGSGICPVDTPVDMITERSFFLIVSATSLSTTVSMLVSQSNMIRLTLYKLIGLLMLEQLSKSIRKTSLTFNTSLAG